MEDRGRVRLGMRLNDVINYLLHEVSQDQVGHTTNKPTRWEIIESAMFKLFLIILLAWVIVGML